MFDLTDKYLIKDLLQRHKLWARKDFGQNFMTDRGVIDVTIEAAELTKNDTILEIGPGLGVLTEKLAESAGKVYAVEKDKRVLNPLLETCGHLENLEVIHDDILQLRVTSSDNAVLSSVIPTKEGSRDSSSLGMTTPDSLLGDKPYKIVANLPFYISSPIFRKFLEQERRPSMMVVMVQKEVAFKVSAEPGNMTVLAVSVQFYGKVEIIMTIPANAFFPAPKVDAAIIKIVTYEKPLFDVDVKKFFRIVKAGFSEKRKKLANSLAGGLHLDKSEVEAKLKELNFDTNIRAERLSMEDWYRLYEKF